MTNQERKNYIINAIKRHAIFDRLKPICINTTEEDINIAVVHKSTGIVEYVYVNCYKCYKEYGIAITKSIDYNGEYCLTDIETGLKAHTKRFFTVKHAKSFMEHIEDINFKEWYEELEKARKTKFYSTYPKVNKL